MLFFPSLNNVHNNSLQYNKFNRLSMFQFIEDNTHPITKAVFTKEDPMLQYVSYLFPQLKLSNVNISCL